MGANIAVVYRGAYSVGAHLVTNNGDNDGLFRAGRNILSLEK